MQTQYLNVSNLWNKLDDKQAEKVRGGHSKINAVTTVITGLNDSTTAAHEVGHAHGRSHLLNL
jgi:hypothetical protein